MVTFVDTWTLVVAEVITAIAVVMIAVASIEATISSVVALAKYSQSPQGLQEIRWRYGRWLTLSLDFLIAGDILRTAVEPGWTQIGQLAAIVALRTVITYSLTREIREERSRSA